MSEFGDALRCEQDALTTRRAAERVARLQQRQQFAAVERIDFPDPHNIFGVDTDFAIDFMKTMISNNMPSSEVLYRRGAQYASFLEKVLQGTKKHYASDPVRGYVVGAQKVILKHNNLKTGIPLAYYCEDGGLYEAKDDHDKNGIIKLAVPWHYQEFHAGIVKIVQYEYIDYENHSNDGIREAESFREMQLAYLLPKIAALALNSSPSP